MKVNKTNNMYYIYSVNSPNSQPGFYLANLKKNTLSKKLFKNINQNIKNLCVLKI